MADVRYVVSKNIFRSKTAWVNAIAGFLAVAAAIPGSPLGPIVVAHPGLAAGLAAAVYLGNLALRYLTDQPIHILPQ